MVLVVFSLWISPGFILSLVVNFEFFNRYFPVTALGLDHFSGAYPNKVLLWGVTDNSPV